MPSPRYSQKECLECHHVFGRNKPCPRHGLTPQRVAAILDTHTIPEPNSGCWLWDGRVRAKYGVIYIGKHFFPGTHRLSYERWKGPIPDGIFVCHRCDNPLCINPDHLFLGTCKDNTQDAKRKGRLSKPPKYKGYIPEEVISAFLARVKRGASIRSASYEVGISESHGSRVRRGLRRAEVAA